jgi:hypothetical protein
MKARGKRQGRQRQKTRALYELERRLAMSVLADRGAGYSALVLQELTRYVEASEGLRWGGATCTARTLIVRPYYLPAPELMRPGTAATAWNMMAPVIDTSCAACDGGVHLEVGEAALCIGLAVANDPVAALRVLDRIEAATEHVMAVHRRMNASASAAAAAPAAR